MMVMVLLPGGGVAALTTTAWLGVAAVSPSWRACSLPSLSGLPWAVAGNLAATTAVGSPPSGSLTNSAQDTATRPNRPSTPASNCGPETGSLANSFRFSWPVFWPSGAFRSSATAQILANHSPKSSTRRFRAGTQPETKRGDLSAAPRIIAQYRCLVRNRGLRARREGRVDLGAAQQVFGHNQRLVVLRIRRHVGLRTGLLLALGGLK